MKFYEVVLVISAGNIKDATNQLAQYNVVGAVKSIEEVGSDD